MRLSIRHETLYEYATPVASSVQRFHLTPVATAAQEVISWEVLAEGMAGALEYRDGFGNIVHLVTPHGLGGRNTVVAQGVVETSDRAGVTGLRPGPAADAVFLRRTRLTLASAAIRKLAAEAAAGRETLPSLHWLMEAVHRRVAYESGATAATTTAAEAYAGGRGVCQDHAHIFISAARHSGIPARYVTGYVASGAGHSELASHAWAEALVPELGWVAFDPSHSICPRDEHVRVACGLDAEAVAPIKGIRRGGLAESMSVAVSVSSGNQ